ncbi:MAG TPA: hypothetical protein VLC92_05795 [Rhodocyclaceae bacterium]|nr:hypothetical protein [Rhodocyclaceae bacterium]
MTKVAPAAAELAAAEEAVELAATEEAAELAAAEEAAELAAAEEATELAAAEEDEAAAGGVDGLSSPPPPHAATIKPRIRTLAVPAFPIFKLEYMPSPFNFCVIWR